MNDLKAFRIGAKQRRWLEAVDRRDFQAAAKEWTIGIRRWAEIYKLIQYGHSPSEPPVRLTEAGKKALLIPA